MSSDYVKRAAELLKMGATMLTDACPICGVPLYRFRGDVFCPKCGRKILLVRGDQEAVSAKTPLILADIEESLLTKIVEVNSKLSTMEDLEGIKKAGEVLNTLLEALSTVRKLRKT